MGIMKMAVIKNCLGFCHTISGKTLLIQFVLITFGHPHCFVLDAVWFSLPVGMLERDVVNEFYTVSLPISATIKSETKHPKKEVTS